MPLAALRTGVSLYHESHGDGAPLVLIMGTSADHTYWAFQTPAYARHFRTIVFDSRGTGQSTKPEDPTSCTMRVLAEDLKALLEHLGIDRAHVSGLSLGSTVAQELALAYPETVATLQLHGTWGRPDPAFVYAIEGMKYPLLLGDYPGFLRTAFAWILTADFLNHDPAREGLMQAALGNPHPPSIAGILGHIHADIHHDAWDRLGSIRCPTLVTAGERDIQVPPRLGEAVAGRIAAAEYHLFTGRGSSHLACVERAEEFNTLTIEWLKKHPMD
jgi:pimeloyl-ACP methyl ester carboxylesterase